MRSDDSELKRVLRSVNRPDSISNALSPSPVALAMCFPFIGGRSPSASKDAAAGSKDAAAAATAASTWTSTSTLNGEAFAYDDPAKLHHQLRQKERELRKREEENQSLREQLISQVRRKWKENQLMELVFRYVLASLYEALSVPWLVRRSVTLSSNSVKNGFLRILND